MDFGYRSESVLLLAGLTPSGIVCILREHCRKEILVSQHVDALNRWHEEGLFRRRAELGPAPVLEFIGIDPAGNSRNEQTGDTSAELFTKAGYKVRFRQSEISFGVRIVRQRIAPAWRGPGTSDLALRPRLLVNHNCTRLIECLTRYRYDERKPESLEPLKDGHDHACDALRYMLLNLDARHKTESRDYLRGGR